MWHFDESAAQFPAPRAEEPADLRREIVEELADHLTCAQRREQLAAGPQTEEAVRRRVLDRFGDPAAVACKLWLDWMWEKIMTQRILVGVCVIMAIVSCVALGLAWTSLDRQQDLMATWQLASETQIREQQKLFERLLAQSEKAKSQVSASTDSSVEWNPVELKFVSSKQDGPPVVGVKVGLSISTGGTGIPPMHGVSDGRGIVRFERVHYGSYSLLVTTPSGEYCSITLTQQPGEGLFQTIVCPDPPAAPANVHARIAWPTELAGKPLWFRFNQQAVYRPIGDRLWRGPSLLPQQYSEVLLVEPNGAVHGMERRDANLVSQPVTVRSASGQRRRTDQLPFPIITWNHFAHEFVKDHPGGMAWPGIGYEIRDLEVLVPVPDVSTLEELRGHELRYEPNAYRDIDRIRKDQQYFYAIHFRSAGWPHRIEEGVADKPGALWLTPTAEAVGKVKQALAEIDQANLEATQPAEKAKSNAEKKPDSAADQKAQSEPTEKKESDTENKANGPE